jgi:hypothetical protein
MHSKWGSSGKWGSGKYQVSTNIILEPLEEPHLEPHFGQLWILRDAQDDKAGEAVLGVRSEGVGVRKCESEKVGRSDA